MVQYCIRLDDACEYINIENWRRIELLLHSFQIKPLVGIIPKCNDSMLMAYDKCDCFEKLLYRWKQYGWSFALHGYTHEYSFGNSGINPVNNFSEFAGVSYEEQLRKITEGYRVLIDMDITPTCFFAPGHTFDEQTVNIIRDNTPIRIISDTIALWPYSYKGMTFVPVQSGSVRRMPIGLITFCYHPNTMSDNDFLKLEQFLKKNKNRFVQFPSKSVTRKKGLIDKMLSWLYFSFRKIRKMKKR